MQDVAAQLTCRPVHHRHRIDQTFVADPRRPEQPHQPGGVELRVLQPGPHEEVLAAYAERGLGSLRMGARPSLIKQIRRTALIGIQIEDPGA